MLSYRQIQDRAHELGIPVHEACLSVRNTYASVDMWDEADKAWEYHLRALEF